MTTQRSDAALARMLALHPTEIDLSLDRMHRLLAALGNPERKLPPVIHIAGTNGKGSTLAMLRAGLAAAGLRVHAYTSPHLVSFHERIELAGQPIAEAALADVLERTLSANADGDITFFEATTAAAFLAFAESRADIVLLEVGLGGRLDATNVIEDPLLTIVTPVDMDHMDFLGPTLDGIAAEKAGILKRKVPCIVGRQQESALEVIERRAARLHAPIHALGQQWHVGRDHGRLVFQDETGLRDLPLPALPGPHQIENAGAALAALRLLGHGDDALEGALTQARWPARMERLRGGVLSDARPEGELWLDGGHNPHAAQALSATLDGLPKRPLHLIVGLQGQKDAEGYLAPLLARAEGLIAVPVPNARGGAADPDLLVRIAKDQGTAARTAASFGAALSQTPPTARVLICGSLYLAGDVLKAERGRA